MSGDSAPKILSGSGIVAFAGSLVAMCDRFELSNDVGEVVGRHLGHVEDVGRGDVDVMVRIHTTDWRLNAAAVWFQKIAKGYNSLTEAPAVSTSANFYHGERKALLASGVGCTLSRADATTWEVYKSDMSVKYVKATDYTATTSLISRLSGGAITSGQEVSVFYNAPEVAAEELALTNNGALLRGTLAVSFISSATGFLTQYYATLASPVGGTSYMIQRGTGFAGCDITFRIIHDSGNAAPYGVINNGLAAVKSLL
jgi:hypothetical protein